MSIPPKKIIQKFVLDHFKTMETQKMVQLFSILHLPNDPEKSKLVDQVTWHFQKAYIFIHFQRRDM